MSARRKVEAANVQPGRRKNTRSDSFRVGRTLAGDAQRTREEKMRRVHDRKKRQAKNIATVVGVLVLVFLVLFVLVVYARNVYDEYESENQHITVTEPTVTIVDENSGENLSQRAKEFIVHLEDDAKDFGFTIDHIVLPFQKAREIDVYVTGRNEYYKMSLDRDSAVQAEDLSRMVLYLSEREIKPSYVDLRVEGKAYYK